MQIQNQVFSHNEQIAATSCKEFTNHQMSLFEQGVTKIKEYYPNIKYIHAEASNGILNVNSKICNLVRPGIILYGYTPTDTILTKIDLKPVANKIKSVSKDLPFTLTSCLLFRLASPSM